MKQTNRKAKEHMEEKVNTNLRKNEKEKKERRRKGKPKDIKENIIENKI